MLGVFSFGYPQQSKIGTFRVVTKEMHLEVANLIPLCSFLFLL